MMFEVEIELNGKAETLKPSLRAGKVINNAFGNYVDALRQLHIYDHSAYSVIVAAALGKKPADVEEAVFATGLNKLSVPLALFVNSLACGGRDPAELERTEDAAPGKP